MEYAGSLALAMPLPLLTADPSGFSPPPYIHDWGALPYGGPGRLPRLPTLQGRPCVDYAESRHIELGLISLTPEGSEAI